MAIGNEAREKILKGANFLADAVKLTLGPAGQNFIIEKGLRVTNDGISVANEITSNDELENLGLRVIKEACAKTNDAAGDGTTTAITLAQAILNDAVKYLPKTGVFGGKKSPVALVSQIKKETEEVIEKLKASAKPVTSAKEMVEVARVAVEYADLADMIGETQWLLGAEGTIIAEETAERNDSIEMIKGIRIDNGFGTSLLLNNQEKQSLELENVHVILTNYTLQNLRPLEKIITQMVNNKMTKIVIVARAFTEEAIKICMENHKQNVFLYPINAPYTDQTQVMMDMAAVLGGTFVNYEEMALEDMQLSDIGMATKVQAYRYNAIFSGEGKGIEKRVETLKGELSGEVSEFSKKELNTRIGQMTNGFALLKVGGTSERERKHRYDKAVDACNAVKSALQEGTVKGGGLALKEIADAMPETAMLKGALKAPYEQIQANAGETLVIEDWVRDSLKSTRIGLEQASSVAAQLATTFGAAASEFPKSADEVLGRVLRDNQE